MNKRGITFAIFTAVVSGFSIFVNKFGLSGFDPYIFTGMKNIAVAVFLIAALMLLKDHREIFKLTGKQWGKLFAIGLAGGSIPFLLFFKGLSLASSAMGAFIHKTMFVFVAIGAVFFLKEKVDRRFIIAALFLLSGNFLLLKLDVLSFGMGEALILIATLFWAGEQLISKHALKEMSSRVVAFGRMFFGSAIIMMFWASTGRLESAISITGPQLAWIGLTAAFLLLYVVSWYYALQQLKAHVAVSILLLGSPVTTILSVAFLGATFTIGQAFGMLMIVGGVVSAVGIAQAHGLLKWFFPSRT
ncbi:MAG: DMT family transporter [Candidatus Woesearchaeota archaeon]